MPVITQHRIARELGVSRSTVAAVFCNNPRVNSQTRQQVLAVASRLGYRPHRYARIMRKGKSGMIGMIQWGGHVPMASQLALHIARAIHGQAFQLLSSDAFWFTDGGKSACDAMIDARVEGVVLLSPGSAFEAIRQAGIPMVAISGIRFPGMPQVRCDARQGMFDLTRHLLSLGHRRLALLIQWPVGARDESHYWYVTERIKGFREAASQAGLAESQAEVVSEDFLSEWSNPYQTGKVAMGKILQRAERPRAVLCSNDDWAIGALTACAEAGARVPEEIAVTGFDNGLAGHYGSVPLTTVAQPINEMAQKAVDVLLKMIRGQGLSPDEELIKMPCRLVVRNSCGAPKKRGEG